MNDDDFVHFDLEGGAPPAVMAHAEGVIAVARQNFLDIVNATISAIVLDHQHDHEGSEQALLYIGHAITALDRQDAANVVTLAAQLLAGQFLKERGGLDNFAEHIRMCEPKAPCALHNIGFDAQRKDSPAALDDLFNRS